jgi:hypothetical protein
VNRNFEYLISNFIAFREYNKLVLTVGAAATSETSVNFNQIARRNNPDYNQLHTVNLFLLKACSNMPAGDGGGASCGRLETLE